MNPFGPRDDEEQFFHDLAKGVLDQGRTQLERELMLSQLLHAALRHKRMAQCFWEAAEEARAERPTLKLVQSNAETEL